MRLSLAALLVAGCTGSRSPVHGSYVYRYPDGTTVPVDLSGERFQAYVLRDDGYIAYPPQPLAGGTDGTFSIPDVPDEPFLLRRSSDGFYGVFTPHDDHAVTETWDVLGRPGAAPVARPTMLEIDATGLAAWHADDTLFVDCFGNASELVAPNLYPPLAAGATTIQSSFDWSTGYSWGARGVPYLMDPAAGDQLVIAHATTTTAADVRTSVVTQVLTAGAPTQIEGQSSRVAGAFSDVARTRSLAVALPGDRLAPMLERGLTPVDQGIVVVAGPATGTGALLGPELARVSTSSATVALSASVTYGSPFDAAWRPRIAAWFGASRHLDTGHLGTLDVPYTAFTESRPVAGDRFTFEPLAPVAGATLDGVAISGQSVSVPPHRPLRLDFVAPAEATKGRVIVWRVDKGFEAAYVEITGAPIDLPIDIFQAGGRYAFEIDMFADDGDGQTRTASAFTDAITLLGSGR